MPIIVIGPTGVITFIYKCIIIYLKIENLVNECFLIYYNLLHEGLELIHNLRS